MNRLSKETSPYLLQHAHNPVDWYPWGDEALQKAVEEDKPLLVSIGYAACHWCHVMERESFEDALTADYMNRHFVNVKIDREERPDLDHIYMDAVQAMQGQGGWPLNVFLTPDKKPFYGGTYFPPQPAFNRPSWMQILSFVTDAFGKKRAEIEAQADQLTSHIEKSNNLFQQSEVLQTDSPVFAKDKIDQLFATLIQSADRTEGGFGRAPKFPQTFSINFLLQYFYHTHNKEAIELANLSLDKMIRGGIYDQLGGGLARYSTDAAWLAPHFEKMLYDNALFIMTLSDAFSLTRNRLYRDTIAQTLKFISRELTSPEGAFFSALDADSEGVEGKYYTWSKNEIKSILGDKAELFCDFFDVSEKGNWEHTNILRVLKPFAGFAAEVKRDENKLREEVERLSNILLEEREKRIRPLLDDKILLGWNALMITAYSKAYAATDEPAYRQAAVRNFSFLWENFRSKDGTWRHTFKNGEARYPAFLDDLAYLVQACIHLQEITGEGSYLIKGKELTERIINEFGSESNSFFYYTPEGQKDVIVRKQEIYDGATPSGNSVMAWNLYYLGIVFDRQNWLEQALKMCNSLEPVILKYPSSFGIWATLMQSLAYGIPEIALIGENFGNLYRDILRTFIPFKIFQSAPRPSKDFPLLDNKPYTSEPKLYLCKNYSCQSPVTEIDTLIRMLEKA